MSCLNWRSVAKRYEHQSRWNIADCYGVDDEVGVDGDVIDNGRLCSFRYSCGNLFVSTFLMRV